MPHTPTYAVVWIDFREARIFLVTAEDIEHQRIKAHTPHRQIHHKANEVGSGHVHDDRHYFEAVAAEIANVDAWLLVGPGATKHELEKHLDPHPGKLKSRLIGVEAMDYPTDGELLAHARKLFKAHERMAPNDLRAERPPHGG